MAEQFLVLLTNTVQTKSGLFVLAMVTTCPLRSLFDMQVKKMLIQMLAMG
jgi:hypothetical protein